MPRYTMTVFSFPQDYFKPVESTLMGQPGPVERRVLPYIPTIADQTKIVEPSPTAIVTTQRRTRRLVNTSLPLKKAAQNPFRRLVSLISILILFSSIIALLMVISPKIYFSITSPATVAQQPETDGTPIGGKFMEGVSTRSATVAIAQPPVDESLPTGDWIIIPRIGVRTQLQETDNQEKALEKGIWRIPGYGQPGQAGSPVILASHRFGYTWWWQDNYWKYNSFHLLPETEPGDLVEIISGQRKYTYEIYAGEEGKEITDYNADLILYTCKYLDSPVRYFRYGRLVDWSKNTQASAH